MLIIRFSRVGKRNHAQYRIVLAEKSAPVQGRFVETLGSYDPHQKDAVFKEERINYWLGNGVQCSDSVYNLLVSNGIIKGEKRKVAIPPKEVTEEEQAEEAPKAEAEESGKTEEKGEKKEEKEDAVTEDKKEEAEAEEEKRESVEEKKEEEKEEKKEEKVEKKEAK